jgi:Tannase and feruloyl esterase
MRRASFHSGSLRWMLLIWAGVLARTAIAESINEPSTPSTRETRCSSQQQVDFSAVQDAPTQVLHATQVPLNGEDPAYCLVSGYVAPQVGFELRMPSDRWNGKLLAAGNGGWGLGVNGDACEPYVKRGYACIASNMGHVGTGADGLWAVNNLQAQVDFAYRSTHVIALAGKAIVSHYYARNAERAYFVGCSTGGYQGMVEAQRFPWDFDGIIAGAPDMDEAELTMRELWGSRSFLDGNGRPILDKGSLELVHRAVLAKCDRDDGVADGIIGNPMACDFDPATLACKSRRSTGCLTPPQVEAVRRIYLGPPEPRGRTLVRGMLPGSELAWADPAIGIGSIGPLLGQGFLRYMIYGASPNWAPENFDFAHDYQRLGMGALYTDTNPDLRKFKAAGGKLLVYQGWNDIVEMPSAIVDYYEMAERIMGGHAPTQDFFRLFMVPGMSHCTGGLGAYAVDYLGYLEAWVERSTPPDSILGGHVSESYLAALPQGSLVNVSFDKDGRAATPVTFTRPIYPYPQYARYKGVGDPNNAASFAPSAP